VLIGHVFPVINGAWISEKKKRSIDKQFHRARNDTFNSLLVKNISYKFDIVYVSGRGLIPAKKTLIDYNENL
jgi:hypothetical protein